MNTAHKLLTIGDSSIDQFMQVEDDYATEVGGEICFLHGSKVPIKSFHTSIAGNALNVSVSTAKMGIPTALYTEIGDDHNADRIIKELTDKEVNTDFCIKEKDSETDVHPIVAHRGDRTIFIYHAARQYKVRNWAKPQWIYYSSVGKNFTDFQEELITYIKHNQPLGIAFNPGTYHLKNGVKDIQNFLAITDVLFVNREEAEKLGASGSLKKMHQDLQKLGAKLTVITDGNNGASAYDGTKLESVPIFEEKGVVADKTGAGDAFSAGFLAAIIKGKGLHEALMWGAINSSGKIRQVGSSSGIRSEKEIVERLKGKK